MMQITVTQIGRLERDIAPPMKQAITLTIDANGDKTLAIYLASNPFTPDQPPAAFIKKVATALADAITGRYETRLSTPELSAILQAIHATARHATDGWSTDERWDDLTRAEAIVRANLTARYDYREGT